MALVCFTFHHIKTRYTNFNKVRFEDLNEFYELTGNLLEERLLLQTSTRVEIYAVVDDIYQDLEKLLDILSKKSGLKKDTLKEFFKIYMDKRAAEHIFRLAGSIESRVMGETYIPLQVESAFEKAKRRKAVRGELETLFGKALELAKRARAETEIEGTVDVVDVALKQIHENIDDLNGKNIVLLGAGLTGQNLAKRLKKFRPKYLTVINRNFDIALKTAEKVGASVLRYEESDRALKRADILICATLASHYRVTPEFLDGLKRDWPLLIVDVSPFRNVDPKVAEIEGIILKDERIRKAMEENFESQKKAVPQVEKLIGEYMADYE